MLYKLLLAGLLVIPAIRIPDTSQLNMPGREKVNTRFNFMHQQGLAKNPVKAAAPFWETGQQNKATRESSALKQSSWYANAIKSIAESEYQIRYDEQSRQYASPNRKNNLLAFYTGCKFTLVPHNDSADKWILDLKLLGIYAADKKIYSPSPNPSVSQSNKTIRFEHNNDFITEYVNSPDGVRQNFIINRQPIGNPQQLSVKLKANKGWLINKVQDKEIRFAKAFKKGHEDKIIYNSLKVWDSNKKELDAFFEVKNNEISILVNTNDAIYPVTIDPLSTGAGGTPDWIGDDADQAFAIFGNSVSSAGDVNGDGYSDVIIGAYQYDDGANTGEGRAFVYHGSASGLSTTPNSTPDDADQANAFFGCSVSGAGDVNGDGYSDIIIGAYGYDDGANIDEGRAFVYYGSPAGLSATPNNTPDDCNQANAYFGNSVSTAGDINGDGYSDVIIGVFGYDDGANTGEGRAFVYHGSATGLSATPNSTPDDANQGGANFGISVSSAGDVNGDGYSDVIIGAYRFVDGANSGEGRAFVYHGSATGLSATPNDTPDDADQANAFFGYSVSSAGDVNGDGYSDVIIGAYQYDDGATTNEGRAFVYYGSAAGLSATPNSTPDDADQTNAYFGWCVSSAGDVNGDGYSDVIIGANRYDDGVNVDEGRAFVYYGSPVGLSAAPSSTPDDADQGTALFGVSVSSAGDVNGDGYSDVIIGANSYNDGANTDEGRAFVYNGGPLGLPASPNNIPDDANQASVVFGVSVACAGDVNGDGYSDVVIGAYGLDGPFIGAGAAFVYFGSATGLSNSPASILYGFQTAGRFGNSVACAGDVNGDGYSDVIIGANTYADVASPFEGRAYIYHGSGTGLPASPNSILDDANQANAYFGCSVASAGDVNGDGYSDVIIGSWLYDDGANTDEGRAFVHYGSATGVSLSPNSTPDDSNHAGDWFGISVSSAGDINGDGYSDVIIGAYQYDDGANIAEGRAFVYYGSAAGLAASPGSTPDDANLANAYFGCSVACAGDVNGDGFSDVIIGAYRYNDGANSNEGRAYVYYGSAAGLAASPVAVFDDADQANANFGWCVASAGDVNGDGYSDVIIGAFNYDDGANLDEGRAFVYYGSASGFSAVPDNTPDDADQANVNFGFSVASAGDVNGDGFSDVIIGAYRYDDGVFNDEGRAFVYYGNNGGGLRNNLRLYNTDLTTPIQRSNYLAPNIFGAGLFAKSPMGRVKGKLAWEVKANGVAFSGSPITNSTTYYDKQTSFTNLGITGVELKSNVQKRGRQTKIRVRVEYDKATAIIGQVYGPWCYQSGYTQGAYGMNSVPLPLTLISFNGHFVNTDDAQLQWITTNEINLLSFVVERSIDGINFTTAGELPPKGISGSRAEYLLLDKNVKADLLYYRLKLKEQNGDISYSNIVTIRKSKIVNALIAPNPVSSCRDVILTLQSAIDRNKVSITVLNVSGQILFTEHKLLQRGKNEINISTREFAKGIYLICISGDVLKETFRLAVQ